MPFNQLIEEKFPTAHFIFNRIFCFNFYVWDFFIKHVLDELDT